MTLKLLSFENCQKIELAKFSDSGIKCQVEPKLKFFVELCSVSSSKRFHSSYTNIINDQTMAGHGKQGVIATHTTGGYLKWFYSTRSTFIAGDQ